MKQYQPHVSSLGNLAANFVAMLCYLAVLFLGNIGLIVCILILATERNSGLTRFSAVQALVLYAAWGIATVGISGLYSVIAGLLGVTVDALGGIQWGSLLAFPFRLLGSGGSVVTFLLFAGVAIAYFLFLLLAAVRAYRWKQWQAPLVGRIVFALLAKSQTRVQYNGDGPVPPVAQLGTPAGTQGNSGAGAASNHPQGASPGGSNQGGIPTMVPPAGAQPPPAGAPGQAVPPKTRDPNEQLPPDMRDPPKTNLEP